MGRKPKLSDWELDEMALYARRGWTRSQLAWHYGVSTKTVERAMRRHEALRADSRPAVAENE